MGKGAETRAEILDHAAELATRIGLGGLSIGGLASDLDMSKSGLFAHFGSKQSLQVQTIESAAARFVDGVVRPALTAPAGEARIQALFDGWLAWVHRKERAGCLFVQSSAEFDDQPGPVRDALADQQARWLSFLSEAARRAVAAGDFASAVDPEQFAFELHALLLGYHHAHRMLRDELAGERLRAAFKGLLDRARTEVAA